VISTGFVRHLNRALRSLLTSPRHLPHVLHPLTAGASRLLENIQPDLKKLSSGTIGTFLTTFGSNLRYTRSCKQRCRVQTKELISLGGIQMSYESCMQTCWHKSKNCKRERNEKDTSNECNERETSPCRLHTSKPSEIIREYVRAHRLCHIAFKCHMSYKNHLSRALRVCTHIPRKGGVNMGLFFSYCIFFNSM